MMGSLSYFSLEQALTTGENNNHKVMEIVCNKKYSWHFVNNNNYYFPWNAFTFSECLSNTRAELRCYLMQYSHLMVI